MSTDYADQWAEREQVISRMGEDQKRAYASGLTHAYTDVFSAIAAAFDSGEGLGALLERVGAQWDDVRATQVVRGIL
jgi:hypothetical protein